jgi:hypothetical protein
MAYPLRESINLGGLDLTLYQYSQGGLRNQAADNETNVVQLSGEPIDVSEEPLVMDTFHLGALYSWRLLGGTYAYAINADARFPRLVLPGPLVTTTNLPVGITTSPRCGQDYNGNFYVGVGRYVYSVPGGTGTPVLSADFGAGVVAWAMDTFQGNLYVGTSATDTAAGGPGPLWQVDSTGAWTGGGPNRKSIAHAWYQAQASGTVGAWQLIGQDTLSSVANCATGPMTPANWGASVPVGDQTYPINSLISSLGHIYVAKTNGLHDVDGTTGFTPNLMPFYESAIDPDNGVAGITANGSVYVNSISGLFRLDVSGGSTTGRITAVTPGHGLPNETPIRGKITAMTSYGPWVIGAVYNGVDTYIMWGRDIRQGDAGTSPFGYGAGYGPSPQAIGPSPMLWHGALIFLPGQICRMLAISGLTSPPRLWLGSVTTSSGQASISWATIARTENPLQDSEYRYATNWQFLIAGQDWQHPVSVKDLLQIDVQADGLGIGSSLTIQVGADGGPAQTFGTANQSPLSYVVGAQDLFGRRLALTLQGSNTSTSPGVIRAISPRAQIRPQLRRIRTYDVLLGEGNLDRFGGRDIGRALTVYQQLEPMQWGGRQTLRDEFGETYPVLVLPPITRKLSHLGGESGKGTAEPVIIATLVLKLLVDNEDLTTPAGIKWDAGHTYDSGSRWGSP